MKMMRVMLIAAAVPGMALPLMPSQSRADEAPLQETHAASQDPSALREKINSQQMAVQEQIESLLGRIGDVTEIVPAMYNEVHSQKDRIELTLEGERTKEKAIQEKIDELTREAQRQIARDAMVAGLEKIAEQKQKDAERMQGLAQQKLAAAAEADLAVSAAAEALVHVQERKEAITAAIGGGVVPGLTKELITISLDIAEQEATLKALQERLVRVENARALYREWTHLAHYQFPPLTQPAGR